jgi:hypothetical protein
VTQLVKLPHAQAIAVRVLTAAGVAGGRISGALPASPAYPLILTDHVNADLTDPLGAHEAARLQFDCYAAASETEARDLAYEADRVLRATRGEVKTEANVLIGWVTAIVRVNGPTHIVEPGTQRQRYMMEHVVYTRATITEGA